MRFLVLIFLSLVFIFGLISLMIFFIRAQPSLASLPLEAFHRPTVRTCESCLRAPLSLATRSHRMFLLRLDVFSVDSLPGHFSCQFSLPQLAAAKSLILDQLLQLTATVSC
jgi:hypothetical protein